MELLSRILSEISEISRESGRRVPPILMAVSKFQSLEKMIGLYLQGQRVFGENYVQELITKKQSLEEMGFRDLEFHFIGKLQTNKVKHLLPHVSAIHSVDSIRLIEEINKRAQQLGLISEIYIQVNIDDEPTKGGFLPSDLQMVCERLETCQNVRTLGLMTIPDPQKKTEASFQRMRELSEQFQGSLGQGLSMGMSADYAAAIRHGSTMIRMGTALFGVRE